MVELTDAEIEAANEAGRIEFETKPHAASAHYDPSTGLLTLNLYNGGRFTIPPRRLQGLNTATDEQLAKVELSPAGYGVHWEELDADFTVPGLLAGHFGTSKFMEKERAKLRAIHRDLFESDLDWDAQAAE